MKKRRPRLLGLLALPVVLTLPTLGAPASAAAPGRQAPPVRQAAAPAPNIVYVLADDFGWTDVSTGRTNAGNPSDYYETPALEEIAREGVAFDNGYTSVNCTPTRAALLTGLYAPRPQNNIYLVGDLNRGGDGTLLKGPAQGRADGATVLPDEAVTIGERLQGAGYATGYAGKFHVSRSGADIVAQHGFDENFGGTNAGDPGAYHAVDGHFHNKIGPELDAYAGDYSQAYVDRNIKPYSKGVSPAALDALVGTDKHVTDALADATLGFVDRHKNEPFFAFVGSYAVHTPVGEKQARQDLLGKYRAKAPGTGTSNPSYGALIEGLDQNVARLVNHLRTTADPRNPGHPLADNTVLLFSGDNGGVGQFTDNGPLRGQKGELREGGIRVPQIAWSTNPRLVRGNRVDHTPVYVADHTATIAALAGVAPSAGELDGTDLSGRLAGSTAPRGDALYWHLPGYLIEGGRDQRPQSVIRSGQWKLVHSYEDHSWELYDLAEDIGEAHNLAAARPEVVQELGGKLIQWLDETDARLATLRDGKAPLSLTVTGSTYADGRIVRRENATVTVRPGDEVPLVLQTPRTSRRG
ncbi:sulfatase [Streptomyces sp. NPDC055962]|uniref:sulfatase n=1 Tax=Streptomyces sp. NPDC055962 TaxID=3345667 RepID=UPI0035E0F3C7